MPIFSNEVRCDFLCPHIEWSGKFALLKFLTIAHIAFGNNVRNERNRDFRFGSSHKAFSNDTKINRLVTLVVTVLPNNRILRLFCSRMHCVYKHFFVFDWLLLKLTKKNLLGRVFPQNYFLWAASYVNCHLVSPFSCVGFRNDTI